MDGYLQLLETAKKQYQHFVEISELYELLTKNGDVPPRYQPPDPENPLTTNEISICRINRFLPDFHS